jgi:soluble lytic murein transglycosylase-like protein
MATGFVAQRFARSLLAAGAFAYCVQAQAFPGDQWQLAGKAHGVDPILLYAVALAESATPRGVGQVSPWPYALRTGDTAHYPGDAQSAAVLLATLLKKESARTLDVGLMQINLHWHGHRVDGPTALLDARTNLNVGAQILAEAMASAPQDPALGIGRYHSWRDDRARWYGNRVLSIYGSLLHSWSDKDDHDGKGFL